MREKKTDQEEKPVVLVGKGLTFDTGGYSLKDTANIQGMKYDKCGAMAVIGTIIAAAQLEIPIPIIAVIGAAENMISSYAYRPDDILTTLAGKTVEIVSTDAEGRLVLADTLTYVQQNFPARAVIDLATLTGGVVVALGASAPVYSPTATGWQMNYWSPESVLTNAYGDYLWMRNTSNYKAKMGI